MVLCDPGRVRTSNHQSRNLIFYPVELRGQSGAKVAVYATLTKHPALNFAFVLLKRGFFVENCRRDSECIWMLQEQIEQWHETK